MELGILHLRLPWGLDARGCRLLGCRGVIPLWRRGLYATTSSLPSLTLTLASMHKGSRRLWSLLSLSLSLLSSLECEGEKFFSQSLPLALTYSPLFISDDEKFSWHITPLHNPFDAPFSSLFIFFLAPGSHLCELSHSTTMILRL